MLVALSRAGCSSYPLAGCTPRPMWRTEAKPWPHLPPQSSRPLETPPSNPYPLLLKGCSLPVSPQPRWPSTMSSFHEQGDSKVLVITRHHASPIPGFTLCPLNKEASAARPRTSAQFGSWVASRLPLPLGPQPTPPPSEMRPAHFIPAS